jgi:hypothetical protein
MPDYPRDFSNLSGDFRNPENLQAPAAQIEALSVSLQKVSAQVQVSKAAPQTVLNNE